MSDASRDDVRCYKETDMTQWTETTVGLNHTPAWDHESNNYQIMLTRWPLPYRLVSFTHEDEDGDIKFWDFATLAEAMQYVEGL